MDYSNLIVSNQMEESISIQRVCDKNEPAYEILSLSQRQAG